MKMKNMLALLLSMVLLLSLASCGKTETPPKGDETPKDNTEENNQQKPDDPDDPTPEDPKDNKIAFESGVLPTLVSAFYDDLTYGNFLERKDNIPDPIVNFVSSVAEFESLLDMETVEMIRGQAPENRTPLAQEAFELTEKIQVTDNFFETKQLITVTHLQTGTEGEYLVAKELVKEEDGSFRLVVMITGEVSTAMDGLFIDMVGIIVDKSIGITTANLTVELIDKTN